VGDAAEDAALRYLQQAGLRLLARNYRTPGRGGGEIDLIMRALETDIKVVNWNIKSLTA
jgi:Holliday junction resolvase-like predicted endonuclease